MVLRIASGLVILLGCMVRPICFAQADLELKLVDGSVIASNISEEIVEAMSNMEVNEGLWSSILSVYTKHAYDKGIRQTVQGDHRLRGNNLFFTPLFTFAEGETYLAVLDFRALVERNAVTVTHDLVQVKLGFTIPANHQPQTIIESVYPAADTLPENLLRMYIHFSSPMSAGEAYEHITLLDEHGAIVEKPFLIIDQELWDEDRTRFTLLFDPGRIKRGIKSNLDLGVALKRGNSYRIVIDSLWRDQHGQALKGSVQKIFYTKAADRKTLSTERWVISEPAAGTRDPLRIMFDRPLDHVLVMKFISIADVEGTASLDTGDRVWSFLPHNVWTAGRHSLIISPLLEDLAGNNFNNPFDIDLVSSKRVNSEEPVIMGFFVKQGNQ